MKFLSKCDIHIAQKFTNATSIMMSNPFNSRLDVKPMKWADIWSRRLRIGNYRFKYVVIEKDVLVYYYDAWTRGDIYKR